MSDVIYSLWQRQIKRYFRSKPRMLSSLAQPILFLVAFGFGFGPIFAKAGAGDYITFLAPGIILMSILFTAVFTGIEVIWDRQFGFLKETLVAPVSRTKIFIGRTLGGATVSLIQGIIVFLITLLIGFRPVSLLYLPVAFVFMFFVGFIFTAIGTGIATVLNDMHAFPLIINFFLMPLFFLSGALFPLENTSTVINVLTHINPVSYCVDALRASLTSVQHFGIVLDFFILVGLVIVSSIVGGYLFSRIKD